MRLLLIALLVPSREAASRHSSEKMGREPRLPFTPQHDQKARHSAVSCLDPPRRHDNVSFWTFDRNGVRSPLRTGSQPDFILEHAVAMPSTDSLWQPSDADSDALALLDDLQSLARRQNVPGKKAMVFLSANENGVGSTISAVVIAVLDALSKRRTLFSPPLPLWAPPDLCPEQDLSCFFSSLPSVGNDTEWGRIIRSLPPAAGSVDRVQLARDRCKTSKVECPHLVTKNYAEKMSNQELDVLNRLPQRWLRRGRFWLISQVLHFLARPNEALSMRLEQQRKGLRIAAAQSRAPMLAVHVRKGDACSARRECRGLAAFMPAVRAMANAYHIKNVLLATPSRDVQDSTQSYPEFQWFFTQAFSSSATARMKAKGVVNIEDGLQRRSISHDFFDPIEEWRSYMVDIYLLASCDFFVGSFTSNAARLAYALMAGGPQSCAKPFHSGDCNWCWAYDKFGPDVYRRFNISLNNKLTC